MEFYVIWPRIYTDLHGLLCDMATDFHGLTRIGGVRKNPCKSDAKIYDAKIYDAKPIVRKNPCKSDAKISDAKIYDAKPIVRKNPCKFDAKIYEAKVYDAKNNSPYLSM